MATVPQPPSFAPGEPQPAWDVARLFPYQGDWNESDYLSLDTRQLVELVDGNLEVLPMATPYHQLIVAFLFKLLSDFVQAGKFGTVFFAPLPVRIRPRTFREPDIMFVRQENPDQIGEKYLVGSDLVMEVVSQGSEAHKRDYEDKQRDYARRGIREYWIVDPQTELITVLTLEGKKYRTHGEFAKGQLATSVLLPEFAVDTEAVFAAGKKPF